MSAGGIGADLGSARGEILIDVAQSERNVRQLQGTLTGFSRNVGGAFNSIGTAGRVLTGLGASVLGVLGFASRDAEGFEQRMSAVQAVTGAVGEQFDALRAKALQLGKDTAFSASESASAIEELAKAGVSVENILGGAADAAVSLAAASGTGIAQSATIIANALNQFGLAGDQATHVADLIAAASATSSAGATDIGDALAYVGTQAAALNIPIEDVVAALAALADQGITGSSAGTDLAAALTSVVAPTQQVSDEMDALGISVQDAQGNFVGLPSLLDQVSKATAGMGSAQREAALSVLFGVRGGRAINALLATQTDEAKAAGKSWNDYEHNVNDAGAAADQAATRMNNLAGDAEQFKGSAETAGIAIGTIFLPALRGITQDGTKVLNAFIGLNGGIQKFAAIGAAAAGIGATLAGGFLLLLPRIAQTVRAFQELRPALAALGVATGPILGVVAALAALGVAYKTNFLGFGDTVNGVAGQVKDAAGRIAAGIKLVAGAVDFLFGARFGNGGKFLGGQTKALTDLERSLRVAGVSAKHAKEIRNALNDMALPLRRLNNDVKVGGRAFNDFFDVLSGNHVDMEKFSKRLDSLFGATTGINLLIGTVRLRRAMYDFGKSVKAATGFDLSKFFSLKGVLDLLSGAVSGLSKFVDGQLLPALGRGLLTAVNLATGGLDFLTKHMSDIVGFVERFAGAVRTDLGDALSVVGSLLTGDFSGALDAFQALIGDVLGQGISIASVAVTVGGWVVDQAVDLYGAVKDKVGEWMGLSSGGGSGSDAFSRNGASIPLGTLAVAIAGWLVSSIVDLGAKVIEFVDGIWPAIRDAGKDVAGYAVRLGAWAISGGETLAGDVVTFLVGIWPAVKDAGADLEGYAIRLGAWLISEGDKLGGQVQAFVEGIWPSIRDAGDTLGGYAVRLGGWIASEAQTGELLGKVKTKVGELLANGVDQAVDLKIRAGQVTTDTTGGQGSIVESIKSAIASAVTATANFADDIATAVWDKITSVNWASVVTVDSFSAGRNFTTPVHDAIVAGFKAAFALLTDIDFSNIDFSTILGGIGKGLLAAAVATPAVLIGGGTAFMSALAGGLTGLVFGDADLSAIGGNILTQIQNAIFGAPATQTFPGLSTAAGSSATSGIVGAITKVFTDIPGKVSAAVGTLKFDIDPPSLPDWLGKEPFDWINTHAQNLINTVNAWAGAIKSALDNLFGLEQQASASHREARSPSSQGGGAFGQHFPSDTTTMVTGGEGQGMPIPRQPENFAPTLDTSKVDSGLKELGAKVADFVKGPYQAIIGANTGPAALALAAVNLQGKSWAESIFQAIFGGNTGPVALALAAANAIGDSWGGRVFTASFSVDLSGLRAAAAEVAATTQFMADHLPHSPAKRGGLSRPINWGWLTEGLAGHLDTARGLVSSTTDALGRSLTNSLGGMNAANTLGSMPVATRSGDTYHIDARTFQVLRSDELVDVMTKAERGHQSMTLLEGQQKANQLVTGRR